jgi:transporter family-2 protein
MDILLSSAALAVGGLLAVQGAANQRLSGTLRSPIGAAAVQLLVALALVTAVAAAAGALGSVPAIARVEPSWLLLAGLASPFYITAGILLFPRIGALNAVALFVAGQLGMSLVIDTAALFGVNGHPFGWGDALGAVAVLAGVVLITRGAGGVLRWPAWAVPYGLAAGAVLPVQAAMNAALARQLDPPVTATLSFAVASAATVVLVAILVATRRVAAPKLRLLRDVPWWGWLGGGCAALYVTASFLLLPQLGAAMTVVLTVTGQQVASALLDDRGWLEMTRRPITLARAIGVLLLVAGAAAIRLW